MLYEWNYSTCGLAWTLFHWCTCMSWASIILLSITMNQGSSGLHGVIEKSAIILLFVFFLNIWVAFSFEAIYVVGVFFSDLLHLVTSVGFFVSVQVCLTFIEKYFFCDLVHEMIYANDLRFVSLMYGCKSNIWFLNCGLYLLYVSSLFFIVFCSLFIGN